MVRALLALLFCILAFPAFAEDCGGATVPGQVCTYLGPNQGAQWATPPSNPGFPQILPEFKGVRLALMGDSMAANNCASQGTLSEYFSNGWISWLQMRADGRLWMPCDAVANWNFGQPGYTTTDMVNTLTGPTSFANAPSNPKGGVLATQAEWVIVQGGRNDLTVHICNQGETVAFAAAQIEGNLLQIYTTLMQAGKNVLRVVIWPISDSQWTGCTATQTTLAQQLQYTLNQWDRELDAGIRTDLDPYRRYARFVVADPTLYMMNGNSSTSAALGNLLYDGLHPSNQGAALIAASMWDAAFSKFLPASLARSFQRNDTYNSVSDLTGNLLQNGQLNGTNGTVTAPWTGTAPDSMTIKRAVGTATGSTLVAGFQYPRADGTPGNLQYLQFNTSSNGSNPEEYQMIFPVISNASIAIGDRIEFGCRIYVNPSVNVVSIQAILQEQANGSVVFNAFSNRPVASGTQPNMPQIPWRGYTFTTMQVVPGLQPIQLVPYISIQVDGTQSGTTGLVWVDYCQARKIL